MVRVDLLEQVPQLAVAAAENAHRVPALKTALIDYLLPLVVNNLGTSDNQVRKVAYATLFTLLNQGFITRSQAEKEICPTILKLSQKEEFSDYPTGGIALMGKIAPFLGQEITERVFLDCFSERCSNGAFTIKKLCASNFGFFCSVVGQEAYEHVLLPCYLNLCTDEIWDVRKACAEVIMSVSCACPKDLRNSTLAPAFAKLLQDNSRWVRMAAFQTLGPFIATFADPATIHLRYDSTGDLVAVNTDGNEFRLTSSVTSDTKFCWVEETPMMYNPWQKSAVYDRMNRYSFSDRMNDSADCEELEDCLEKNIEIDYVALELEVSSSEEVLPEEETKQKGDVIGDDFLCKLTDTMNSAVDEMYPCGNGRLSPTMEGDRQGTAESTDKHVINHIQEENETCDILDRNVVNDISVKLPDISINRNHCCPELENEETMDGESTVENDTVNCVDNTTTVTDSRNENEFDTVAELEEFNSYNYWRIEPLAASEIDLSLSDDAASPVKTRLAALHSTIDLVSLFKESFFEYGLLEEKFIEESPSKNVPSANTTVSSFPNGDVSQSHPVPQYLIDYFVSMADPKVASKTDNEVPYHCAYSLPAVTLTLQSQNWHLLKNTLDNLASDMQYKVRKTVASCLHELAIILGPDLASEHLTPLFEDFLKDLDEVRIGLLKHLAQFLGVINESKRNTYLPRLNDFLQMDNRTNWRFRRELAEQLLQAVPLFPPNTEFWKHMSHIAQELLCDKVAAVRETAVLLMKALIKHISFDDALTSRLLVILAEKFAHSKKWKLRQTFVLLSAQLLTSSVLPLEEYSSDIMPHLMDLSWDPVANVRLVVAKTIAENIITNEYFSDTSNQYYDGLRTVLRRLKADDDRDVRQFAIIHQHT